MACRKAGLAAGTRAATSRASAMLCTAGSPLPAEGYRYAYEQLGPDMLLINGSGGTDVCTGIVSGAFAQPVYEGEISGPCLGVDARAFDARRQRGDRRRAGRAGDHPADALDAGRALERPRTARATAPRTSTATRASGARATGSSSPSAAAACSPGAPTRPSTAAAYGSAPASSTRSSRTSPRSSTRSSCTSRMPVAARASCCCSSSPRRGRGARRRAARAGSRRRCAPNSRRATCRTRSSSVPAIPRTLTGKKLEAPVKRILRGEPPSASRAATRSLDPSALDAFVALAAERAAVDPLR